MDLLQKQRAAVADHIRLENEHRWADVPRYSESKRTGVSANTVRSRNSEALAPGRLAGRMDWPSTRMSSYTCAAVSMPETFTSRSRRV